MTGGPSVLTVGGVSASTPASSARRLRGASSVLLSSTLLVSVELAASTRCQEGYGCVSNTTLHALRLQGERQLYGWVSISPSEHAILHTGFTEPLVGSKIGKTERASVL